MFNVKIEEHWNIIPADGQVPARGRQQVGGAALALVSGALFTANNFVISQLGVILSCDWSYDQNTEL